MKLTTTITVAIAGILLAVTATSIPIHEDQQAIANPEVTIIQPEALTSTLRDTLIDNDVIGDVLDDFEPSYFIDINYPKAHERVLLGNDIPVDSVSERPVFTFYSILSPSIQAKNSTFTLALTDPDATSRDNPKMSEMCHWILTNLTTPIPEPPVELMKAKPGEIEEYLPPSPPPKTGPHRYVFVLLEGDSTNLKAPEDRKHWGYGKKRHGVRDWAEENDLKVVGANFFFAQNEKQ
ncbi:hypothetical protein PV11_05122 [Exophiala sideris]|uniref:YbhB/YbcL family Raf kinase inhibitor-like protein n=1 Tax=Exophiala sideris TaxID=1016849 RepID=A0A0D1YJL8_9EURO|nr:hypothetical protein PV11_05122 [Exophiala sideris]